MESGYDRKKFSFLYNGIAHINLNSDCNIKKFYQDQFISVKFTTYFINFGSKTYPKNNDHAIELVND